MKKTLTLLLIAALAFTGCKKETSTFNKEQYSLSDFTDNRAVEAGVAYKNEIGSSNLRAIVRKVANSVNQYRLILKVDSVYTEVGKNAQGELQYKMIALDMFKETVKVTSGLSIPDPLNPDKESVFFKDGEMQFTRIQENGFYVYASAPFGGPSGTTDEVLNSFDYELVNLQYTITHGRGLRDGYPDGVKEVTSDFTSGNHRCFILPGGKAIEQNPELEKVKKQGKWTSASGLNLVKTLVVTIDNDPAQEAESLVFLPNPVLIPTGDPKSPFKELQLPSVTLVKTDFNQNSGVARFGEADAVLAAYKGVALPDKWTGEGTFFYKRKGGKPIELEQRAIAGQPFYTVTVE
jgi:hypothetical protein